MIARELRLDDEAALEREPLLRNLEAMWLARFAVVGLLLGIGSSRPAASPAGSLAGPARDTRFLIVATVDSKASRPPRVELFSARGRLERVIATADRAEYEAQWAPDGSRLAWTDPRGVAVSKSDGTARRLVFRKRARCSLQCSERFAWSPDGRRLAISFTDTDRHRSRLFVLSLATGRARDLAPPSSIAYYMLSGWSPRGDWIAYTRDTESITKGPSMDLMLVRPDGSRRHRIYRVADALKDGPSVSWSPNGRCLALTTDHFTPADPRLGVIDVVTGKLHRIRGVSAINTGLGPPAWSPDSQRIAVPGASGFFTVGRGGTRVRRIRVAGSAAAWSRTTGDLFIVNGMLSRNVFVSAHGEAPPRLSFRMPRGQSILGLAVR